MRKICLSITGLVLTFFASFAQTTNKDTSAYHSRKLKFDEANLVSSYYRQDGNNAAVTGGIGSEKLSDIANTIDLNFIRWDKKDRKHTFIGEIGIDHYTSASSDKIDPFTISSASHADRRLYPSVNWTMENEKSGNTIGAGLSASAEYDYFSKGVNVNFSKKSKDRNSEFSIKLQAFLDNLKYILPVELRPGGADDKHYPSRSRNSYSAALSFSHVVNERLQFMLTAEPVYQQGYLGLPFHRVYFDNNTLRVENLPDTRMKIPLGIRANYFLGDKVVIRSFYRFYHDDWGLTAHTIQLETSIKFTPFLSVTPYYRYYTQSGIDYFAPYHQHKLAEQYYTSNFDLGPFNSQFFGAGFRIAPPKGVFGIQKLNSLELRYGHYTRDNGLTADIISLNLKWK